MLGRYLGAQTSAGKSWGANDVCLRVLLVITYENRKAFGKGLQPVYEKEVCSACKKLGRKNRGNFDQRHGILHKQHYSPFPRTICNWKNVGPFRLHYLKAFSRSC